MLLQTSQNDVTLKNIDMEITKNAHKKDSWHICDIRRSVAHNYNKNLCEKHYEKKKYMTKTNKGTIVIAKFHTKWQIFPTSGYALCNTIYYTFNHLHQDMHYTYAIQYTTLSITYYTFN